MGNRLNVDIAALSRSVAFLVDRVGASEIVLGCAWLFDSDKAATCAHLVLPYDREPEALKLFFPASQQTRGVSRVVIHPRFDKRSQAKSAPAASKIEHSHSGRLRQYDAAVLLLCEAPKAISENERNSLVNVLSAPIPAASQGLSGKLSEIDFFLVVQTIVNARKAGRIYITDSRNNPIAGLFCQDGLVMHVFFGNLTNELAFYQIVQKQGMGNFYFALTSEPEWDVDKPISRPPEMLFLEAHRRLEETQELLASLGGAEIVYGKSVNHLDLSVLPAEVVPACKSLWNALDGTVAISDLWLLVDFDDYGICMALLELLKTRQIEEVALNSGPILTGEQNLVPPNLVLGLQAPLAANDELCALSVEPSYGLPCVRQGRLLGTLNKEDPNHLLHDIRVLPQAQGCPILKNGEVVGIHCGPMPYGREVQIKEGNLQQMVWVESLIDCLKQLSANETSTSLVPVAAGGNGQSTMVTLVNFQPAATAGCHDAANLSCPKCGAASLCSASECKACGQHFYQDYVERPKRSWEAWTFLSLVIILLVVIVMPQPTSQAINYSNSTFSVVADPDWVSTSVGQLAVGNNWYHLAAGEAVKANLPIAFKMVPEKSCHAYLVDKSSHEAVSLVAYPNPKYTAAPDQLLKKGAEVYLPGLKGVRLFTSTEDTVILFASETELQFMKNPELADDAFNKANSILGVDLFSPAVEVPLSKLSPGNSPPNINGQIVYLRRLIKDGCKTQ